MTAFGPKCPISKPDLVVATFLWYWPDSSSFQYFLVPLKKAWTRKTPCCVTKWVNVVRNGRRVISLSRRICATSKWGFSLQKGVPTTQCCHYLLLSLWITILASWKVFRFNKNTRNTDTNGGCSIVHITPCAVFCSLGIRKNMWKNSAIFVAQPRISFCQT